MSEVEDFRPTKGSKEWQKYIVSHLSDEELVENKPTAAGLRRVCELVYAKIIISQSLVAKTPSSDDRSATVVYEIQCRPYDGEEVILCSASADVGEYNTPEPYCNHAVASAETRAEGRAFKKLMCLDFQTYEEALNNQPSVEPAKEAQVRSIKTITDKLNIDLNKFLALHGGISSKQLENKKGFSKKTATSLLEVLNNYIEDEQKIPQEIRG